MTTKCICGEIPFALRWELRVALSSLPRLKPIGIRIDFKNADESPLRAEPLFVSIETDGTTRMISRARWRKLQATRHPDAPASAEKVAAE